MKKLKLILDKCNRCLFCCFLFWTLVRFISIFLKFFFNIPSFIWASNLQTQYRRYTTRWHQQKNENHIKNWHMRAIRPSIVSIFSKRKPKTMLKSLTLRRKLANKLSINGFPTSPNENLSVKFLNLLATPWIEIDIFLISIVRVKRKWFSL